MLAVLDRRQRLYVYAAAALWCLDVLLAGVTVLLLAV